MGVLDMRSFALKSAAITFALAAIPASALAQNSSLDNLTASQTFPAWQSTMKYQYPASGVNAGKPSGYGNYAKATSSVKYDAATQSYIVRDTGNIAATSTFAPANIVGAESNATYTVYRKSSAGTTQTLRLLNPGAGNPLITLTYASYGHWRTTKPGGAWNGDTAQNDTYFIYGIKTTAAQMPRTGGAHYNTVLDGTFANKTALYTLSGTGSIDTNWVTGGLTFSATPVGTPTSGPVLNFGAINGSGTINFNASSFGASGNNGTYTMNMSGYFFGPTAQEVGAVFRLNGNYGNGTGAIVGEQ
jgi:hypothetical protein